MDDFPVDDFIVDWIEMRNFERAHRLDRGYENLFRIARCAGPPQSSPSGPQRAQHLRAVESLPRTMITETHDGLTIVSGYH
jgi:hypothetical protein